MEEFEILHLEMAYVTLVHIPLSRIHHLTSPYCESLTNGILLYADEEEGGIL